MIRSESVPELREINTPLKPHKNITFQGVMDGITLTAVAVLLVVVFLVYMTQISLAADFSWKDITTEGALMYACTVSIYLLLRSFSIRKGRLTPDYKKAAEQIETNNDTIVSKGYAKKTAEYCREWEDEELKNTRTHILADAGIDYKDFVEKYCKYDKEELAKAFPDLTEYQKKIIGLAQKVKRLNYDESYLSVYDKQGKRQSPSGGMRVKIYNRWKTIQILVTSAVSSFFTVSLASEIIADPSLATVVICLVKVMVIIIFGVWGMVGGYQLSSVREVTEMKAKADEQRRFIKYCEQ